jgi:N-acetylmuramic acid 6-phosphate etherase
MKLPQARVEVSREEGAFGAALLCRSKFTGVRPATKLYRWIKPPRDRGDLYRGSIESRHLASAPTEQPNPRARHLERASIGQLVDLMTSEEATVIPQILRHRESLEQAIQWIVASLKTGGRLFYVGAGTSGRLGVLDAAECPPTFGTPPSMVQGIIAGGFRALYQAIEAAEDDEVYGAESVANRNVGRKDVVVGITASGSTPFVMGALQTALKAGARCILLTCNPKIPAGLKGGRFMELVLETGPEVVAGSTRLKAGTATKLVLNMLTTISMIRLGRVKDNLMTDVQPSCEKLQDRMARILKELRGSSYEEAWTALKREGWNLKRVLARKPKRAEP